MPDPIAHGGSPAMLAATLAMPGKPLESGGARLSVVGSLVRYSLRARDPALLEAETGLTLPRRIGETVPGIACLGPDEWYALLPDALNLPSETAGPFSIVDVTSRAIGIAVDGPGAAALIGTGCPLDLERMVPGRATRTVFETVEIVLWRESETRFHIEVWRSFAPWLWAALVQGLH